MGSVNAVCGEKRACCTAYHRKLGRQGMDAAICSAGNHRQRVGTPEGKRKKRKEILFSPLCFSHCLGFLFKTFLYVALESGNRISRVCLSSRKSKIWWLFFGFRLGRSLKELTRLKCLYSNQSWGPRDNFLFSLLPIFGYRGHRCPA